MSIRIQDFLTEDELYELMDARYLMLDCSNDPLTAPLDVPTLYNSLGALKIMPEAEGNVDLFGDTDVANDANGKSFSVTRRAAEGDTTLSMYGRADRYAVIDANWDIEINSNVASGRIKLGAVATNIVNLLGSTENSVGWGNGTDNPIWRHYGYITAGGLSGQRYIQYKVDDTDDYYWLTGQASILGFKIDMPVDLIDNSFITTGTLGAGAITGTSLTDGTLTIDDGSLTGAVNGTFSGTGTFTGGLLINADNAKIALGAAGITDSYLQWTGSLLETYTSTSTKLTMPSTYITMSEVSLFGGVIKMPYIGGNGGLGNFLLLQQGIYLYAPTGSPVLYFANSDFSSFSSFWCDTVNHVIYTEDGSWHLKSDSNKLYFGFGKDVSTQYTGSYWDFDIALATTAIRFNQSQFDTDFIVYGDTGAMLTLDAGTLYATLNQTLFTDKIKFTQTDGNEYIDSLADGYVDIGATTGIRLNSPITSLGTTNKLQFYDSAIYAYSSADGWLNLVADTGVEFNTPIVNVTGITFASGGGFDCGDAGGFSGIKFNAGTTQLEVWIDGAKIGHYSTDGTYTDDVS